MMWWAVQTVVITAAMVVLIGFAGRWMRVMPAALHILWLLVLVRFVVPPVVEWPWPLTELAAPDAKAVTTDGGAVPFLRLVGDYVAPSAGPRNLPATAAPTVEAGGFTYPSISLVEWLLSVWAIAACTVFVIQFIRLVRVDRMLRAVTTPPAWMQEDVDALAARIAVSPPTVEVSTHLSVPVYWNLGRARLLVPGTLIEVLDREAWNGIFLHELAHHKRRDHWVGWLELVAGCIWWWNPIFWYARRRLREQAELACDAWVISEFPERRRAYADALLRVFESVSQNAERRLAWSMAADIRIGFERRLKMIYASPMSRTASATWLACGLTLLVLVTPSWSLQGDGETPTSAGAQSVESTPVEKPTTETRLDTMVDFEFQNEHIAYICDFLADYAEVNIALDYRVIDPGVVMTQTAVEATTTESSGRPNVESRAKQPTIPNPEYVTDGMVPYIRITNVPLREALRALCRPLNLSYETTPGFIWISSPKNLESETWPLPTQGTGARFEEVVSSSRISIEFEDESILDIAAFVADYLDLNIVVDNRVIAPGSDAGTPSDIVTTGIVPHIKMTDVGLHEVLAAILRPLNLAYRLEDSFIWISSPEKLRNESFRDLPRKAERAPQDTNAPIAPAPGGQVEEEAAAVSVLRIIRWSDGSPRAEIKTEKHRGFFGVGEAFERYEIRSIDSEKKTVEVFDAIENKVETLTAKQ